MKAVTASQNAQIAKAFERNSKRFVDLALEILLKYIWPC